MELYKGKNWDVIYVDWCQEFPGQCIVSCGKQSLSHLTNEDWIELGLIEKELERVCKTVFGATMFNFCCLMNNAYRDNETPHVHFQYLPRYKGVRNILGKEYNDSHFGFNLWKWAMDEEKCQKDIFTKDERLKMYEMMKSEFNSDNLN